ncbi:MAG: YhfC family intramembrane metalloprotease [Oscillospiraceae bacterium]|nr:YhfC family intramembrane metalloprotease [Oscillospiraceae bacterium]
MNIEHIPFSAIICMGMEALFGIVLPLLLAFFWYKKKNGRIIPMLIGAATFFIAAVVLEGIFHALFLYVITPVADFINSNFWVYVLYGSLMAGIFEETGRFISFKLMKKRYNGLNDAVSFGIGHGGFECAYVLGIGVGGYIVMALMINMGLGNLIFAGMTEEEMALTAPIFESISSITPGYALAAIMERISAITFHICNSVIVFSGVKNGKTSRLFVAIAMHALFNIIALTLSEYFGIAVTEISLFAVAMLFAFCIFKIKKGEV